MTKEKEPKYTVKQLRLTNEEIIDKFAIYGAEVDMISKKQQSFDRILDSTITQLGKVTKEVKEMKTVFDVLTYTFLAFIIICGVLFWILTGEIINMK